MVLNGVHGNAPRRLLGVRVVLLTTILTVGSWSSSRSCSNCNGVFFPSNFSFATALENQKPQKHAAGGEGVGAVQRRLEEEREEDDEDDEEEFDYNDVQPRGAARRHEPAWRSPKPQPNESASKGGPRKSENHHAWFSALRVKALFEGPWVDLLAVALFIAVIVTAYVGKRDNQALAQAWLRASQPVLQEQFSKIGFPDCLVSPKSWNGFEFYATGRRNCRFMSVEVECAKRQCFWRRHFLDLIFKEEPVVRFEIGMESLDTMVLGLFRKREQKQFLSEHHALRKWSRPRERRDLPPSLLCCSDTAEVVSQLLKPQLVKAIVEFEPYFLSLVVSDLCSAQRSPKRPRVVRLAFRLPSEKEMDSVAPDMMKLALWIADAAAELRLSEKVREALLKLRSAPTEDEKKEEQTLRSEALEKRRKEKKKLEEERLEKASPEQRRKLEEKQYKKQVKASNLRFKIVKA